MLLVELLGLLEILFLKKARVWLEKKLAPDFVAKGIASAIAKDCHKSDRCNEEVNIEWVAKQAKDLLIHHIACRKEETIPWQDKADQKARLCIDHEQNRGNAEASNCMYK